MLGMLGGLICVLFRGAAPFILRKKGNKYKLIKGCYCHGLIDREAIKDLELGKLKAQGFTLV
jgi:hypothetical protein